MFTLGRWSQYVSRQYLSSHRTHKQAHSRQLAVTFCYDTDTRAEEGNMPGLVQRP